MYTHACLVRALFGMSNTLLLPLQYDYHFTSGEILIFSLFAQLPIQSPSQDTFLYYLYILKECFPSLRNTVKPSIVFQEPAPKDFLMGTNYWKGNGYYRQGG